MLINTYFTCLVCSLIKKHSNLSADIIREYLVYTRHCVYFPLIEVISMIPGTINKIMYLTHNDVGFYGNLFQILFDAVLGIVCSVLFCSLSEVKVHVKRFFRCLGCCRRVSSKDKISLDEEELLSNRLTLNVVHKKTNLVR